MAVEKSENPEPKKTKEEGLSIERQTALLEKMEAMSKEFEELKKSKPSGGNQDLIEALKTFSNNPSQQSYDTLDANGYLNPDLIDPDDVLEGSDIVRFYAYRSNYVIVDDKRQGRFVQTPFKDVIMFEHVGAKTTGVGKHKETEHSCVYSCKSKKEAEWLRNHTLYNITFYASGGKGDIMSVSSKKATRMAALMNNLKEQDRFSIINMCKQHGIPMMESAQDMRVALANKLSEEIEHQERAVSEQQVKEMIFEKKEFEEYNK